MLWVTVVLQMIFGISEHVQAASTPNLIVVMCDDLGWGDLACYGHPHIQTPNLDRLASEGVRLTSYYSAAPVCSPSRVGLLTGRNPNRAGVYDWIPDVSQKNLAGESSRHVVQMRKTEVTLPRLLQQSGYATAMAGKWHCNAIFNSPEQTQPNDAGFEHWFATQNNAAPSHRNPNNFVRNGKKVGAMEGYSCQLVAGEAIQWLESHKKSNSQQPFFLYVTFHEPHEPVASPPELVAKYAGKARNDDEAEFFANVENMDNAVGKLISALDRLKATEDTLIVFTSDNGPETLLRYPAGKRSYGRPGPLRGMKLWTTEAGSRVVGIMRWPGHIQPNQVSDVPVSSLDLLPTFCSMAGAKIPSDLKLDGVNIQPLFDGRTVDRPQPLFWFYFHATNDHRAAMRDGPWKLLAKLDGGELPKMANVTRSTIAAVQGAKLTDFELYKLTDDVGEARDLSRDEPEQLKRLVIKMESMYREVCSDMHVWEDAPLPSAIAP